MKELYRKYRLKKKRLKTLIEELKQRMQVKSAKVKWLAEMVEMSEERKGKQRLSSRKSELKC